MFFWPRGKSIFCCDATLRFTNSRKIRYCALYIFSCSLLRKQEKLSCWGFFFIHRAPLTMNCIVPGSPLARRPMSDALSHLSSLISCNLSTVDSKKELFSPHGSILFMRQYFRDSVQPGKHKRETGNTKTKEEDDMGQRSPATFKLRIVSVYTSWATAG